MLLLISSMLSYETDMKPVFKQRCMRCHNSGPLNWMQYEQAYKYKGQIRRRVWETRTMPIGGDITEKEREKIRDWVNQGAKR